jgi:nucleotide-binding universal stress UspA family protein
MQRPPRDPGESIFSRDVRLLVLLGVLIECPIFLWTYFDNYSDIEGARTKIFLLFVFVELIIALCFRSLRFSLFEAPPHKWLVLAMAWEAALLAVLIQFASVRETFGIRMPTWADLGMALAVSVLVVAAIELTKAFVRATSGGTESPRARRTAAEPGIAMPQTAGANAMLRILIPVGGTNNDKFALQHVIKQFMNNTAMEVHLVNVQRPFSAYVAQFSSRANRMDYHRERSEIALAPAKAMLDKYSIPYAVHMEVGDRARKITDTARRLRCDAIVIATARKNSLTRLVESSVTDKLIELTPVPVEVIAGDSMSKWERYGIPSAIAAALAAALAIED